MSVTAAPTVGGKASDSASLARSDCGLLVGFPSVVSAPPSSATIATTATATAATHPAIVSQGRRAHLMASPESFIDYELLLPATTWATVATSVRLRIGLWARVALPLWVEGRLVRGV